MNPISRDTDRGDYNSVNEISREAFAAGDLHDIDKVRYRHCPDRVWIFKGDAGQRLADGCRHATLSGIPNTAPGFAIRNVVTSIVDNALGLNLVPETRFAEHVDRPGFVMELCDGVTVLNRISDRPLTPGEAKQLKKRQRRVRDCLDGFGDDSLEYQRSVARFESWKADFGVVFDQSTMEWRALDSQLELMDVCDSTLLNRLCDLAWLDAITGQVDRHLRNFLVQTHADGSVSDIVAIDNDFSFGAEFSGFVSARSRAILAVSHTMGLPPVVSATTADCIRRFVAEWDAGRSCRADMESLLTQPELAATDERILQIGQWLTQLTETGFVIPNADWPNWRHAETGQSAEQLLQSVTRGSVGLMFETQNSFRQRQQFRA